MRGRKMSSANFVWPVHLARASTLRNGLPTTLSDFPLSFAIAGNQPQINADLHRSEKFIDRQSAFLSVSSVFIYGWSYSHPYKLARGNSISSPRILAAANSTAS